MEKEFVPYELALRLKALGFDEFYFGKFYTKPRTKMFEVDEKGRHYSIKNTSEKLYTIGEHFVLNDANIIIAPTFSQAFRWFRNEYGYLHHITYFDPVKAQTPGKADYQGIVLFPHQEVHNLPEVSYNFYEEAELACLEKLLEIVESKSE